MIFFRYLTLLILIIFSNKLFPKELICLDGTPQQSEIIIGKIDNSVDRIFLDANEIIPYKNNIILGFDRDEKAKHQLTIILNDNSHISTTLIINPKTFSVDYVDGLKNSYVHGKNDPEWIKRVNEEAKKIEKSWDAIFLGTDQKFTDFQRPVNGGWITGEFGGQRILNGIPKKPHNGLDIAVPQGTNVKPTSEGVIVLTGDYFYLGNFVLVDHGSGLGSVYAHLDTIFVSEGVSVTKKDVIGEVGMTGRATGPHLHWGVMLRNDRIDPQSLLKTKDRFYSIIKE